ncbi:MAG: protein nirF [Hahellaceae bacterium]|nr:protein nirF [Hahellaceae bacterium]
MSIELRGTGDLGLVIERETGSVQIINTTQQKTLAAIQGLGDLSHASVVFSRDERYAYVFGRDGGLTKVDLLTQTIDKRIIQGGNSIGGAISQDGSIIAVSNYEPGGVKLFDSQTLEQIADIPAEYAPGKFSKTVGLVDAPGHRFVFSLYDGGEIWLVDASNRSDIKTTRYQNVGLQPYDALMSPDGRYYVAGLFGEDGMARLDLWHPESGVTRILQDYGKGEAKMPVYKMPHLEGWAIAGNQAFFPAVGRNEVLVMDMNTWQLTGKIPVHGQPVFVMAQPDNRHVWVNFALPHNDTVQVIDTESHQIVRQLTPGKGVLHMEFTPRGEQVWLSVRDENQLQVYDTLSGKLLKQLPAQAPSGIFFSARAHETGL